MYPCEKCLLDMICIEPCEKFEVKEITEEYISTHVKLKRLMKYHKTINEYNYKENEYNYKDIKIQISKYAITFSKHEKIHRDDGPAIIYYMNNYKEWWVNGNLKYQKGCAI